MAPSHPGFRLFVLGAGFSRAAGLPLASELFPEIKKRLERRSGKDTKFQRDIEAYIEYRQKCDDLIITEAEIDFEDFLSFLDMEHFLGLRGSKTWSQEGNESQVFIKQMLAQIIQELTPPAHKLPSVYYRFAEKLALTDMVISFNYDVILERALEHVGKPYRLFQDRYKSVGPFSSTVDSSKQEVVLLKMHGSVDWFSDKEHKSALERFDTGDSGYQPKHPIFTDTSRFGTSPLVDGPRDESDPLLNLHLISKVDEFYFEHYPLCTPFLLSPSHVKFLYSQQLLDFWYGMGRGGGLNLGISVIGFSLPKHDDYIRIGLFKLVTNYQDSWWDEKYFDPKIQKDFVKLVDLRPTKDGEEQLRSRYRFSDPAKTVYHLGGFDEAAVDFLFSQQRPSDKS